MLFLRKRPKKIRSRQRRRLAEAIGGDYIFEPSENPFGESVEKIERMRDFRLWRIFLSFALDEQAPHGFTWNANPIRARIKHKQISATNKVLT